MILAILIVIGAMVFVAGGLVLLARRARRGGVAGSAIAGAMAAYDEAMHTTAHEQFVELRQQAERTQTVSSPDDL